MRLEERCAQHKIAEGASLKACEILVLFKRAVFSVDISVNDHIKSNHDL